MSQQSFLLRDASGLVCSKSFSISPVLFPTSSGATIITADPLLVIGSSTPTTLDIVDNVYKVECLNQADSIWYINVTSSISSPTASANVAAYSTGSYSNTYFHFADFIQSSSVTSVAISPVYEGIGFNDAFILHDTLTYKIDSSGSITIPLVPMTYKIVFEGPIKHTPFQILPSGSACTASNCIVPNTCPSNILIPLNKLLYGPIPFTSSVPFITGSTTYFQTKYFQFATADGNIVSSSFAVSPIYYPTVTGSTILTSDPLTINGSSQLQPVDMASNLYKVELNKAASNDWYITTSGSVNSTASACIMSGSYCTGSLSKVLFDIADFEFDPLSKTKITITPIYINIGYNNTFILRDSLAYYTDTNGIVTINLVPMPYCCEIFGRNNIRRTKFQIYPIGNCTASQIIVDGYCTNKIGGWPYHVPLPFSANFTTSYAISASWVPNLYPQQYQESASWASQSLSASWAPGGESSKSASWASQSLSASYYPPFPDTASWALQSILAKAADFALTSVTSISASWAPSAQQSDYAKSASWASQSLSASWVSNLYPQVFQDSSSWASSSISASYAPFIQNPSASWASQSLSASYYPPFPDTIASASWVSASVHITNADTASYVANLYPQTFQVSASWASSSISASYVPDLYPQTIQESASWASQSLSASYVASASYYPAFPTSIDSASWASRSLSSSYVPNLYPQQYQVSGSWASASISASWAPSNFTGYATSASWSSQSISASWAPVPISASWASRSLSASWAINAVSAIDSTNAVKVLINPNTVNQEDPILFALPNAFPAYDSVYEGGNATYNPSTNTITATNFAGTASQAIKSVSSSYADTASVSSYAGSASVTSKTSLIYVSNNTDGDHHPILFGPLDDGGVYPGYVNEYVGSASYTPSTNTITATNFAGTASQAITSALAINAYTSSFPWATNVTNSFTSQFIGIGTSTPGYTLDVNYITSSLIVDTVRIKNTNPLGFADILFQNNISHSGYVGIAGSILSAAYAAYNDRIILESGNASGVAILAHGTGDIRFYTSGASDNNERVRITNDGKVGIGIQSVVNSLDVNGNISCSVITASLLMPTSNSFTFTDNNGVLINTIYGRKIFWSGSVKYVQTNP